MTRFANQRGNVTLSPESTPSIVVLDGISYYAPPHTKGRLQGEWPNNHRITPATLISFPHHDPCASAIAKTIEDFFTIDDVYSAAFASHIIIQKPSAAAQHESSPHDDEGMLLEFPINDKIVTATAIYYEGNLPSGPYFVRDRVIHEAWRLYCDHLDAFEITVVPHEDTNEAKFSILTALSANGIWRNVAVPSRLYARPSIQKPLAGARISVKDNFRLAGVKTTMTSRAFTELYSIDNETAAYVCMLMEMGAIIVGKTRMSSFAVGESPTDQWIDFHCPFNPRGDEYQGPDASSSGAAASLAGYSWLDYSIGTDTGSIRGPAATNGLYGFRPTFGNGAFDGIFHLARTFDTIGLLSRDLPSLYRLACSTMNLTKPKKYPGRILYPKEFFPTMNDSQQVILDEFVSILENQLQVKRTIFGFTETWTKNPPTVAKGKSLQEYLKKSTYQVYYHDAYHEFDQFREDYRSAHGKEPYVGPVVRFRWDIGSNISSEERNQADFELNTFRVWFHENVLKTCSDSLSEAVLVLPAGKATPDYRDEPNPPPTILEILGEYTIAMVLGIPNLVLPIGQVPYESRVSGRTEHRPISVSLIGAKGSDAMLMRLACDTFKKAGWSTKVEAGRYTFPLGTGVRNVAES